MSRLARPAARLAAGSAALTRRLGARATAWVARGRRHDLTGWKAALGCWARLAALTLGGYLLWRLVRAVPGVMWMLTGAWAVAAWRAGRPPADEAAAEAPQQSGEAIRALLLDLMSDAPAIHLRTVLAHLQEHGQWEGRTVGDLRVHLEALGIPVHPKVKTPGSKTPTRGVRKADLAPTPAVDPVSSTTPSTAA
ncbi:hypothetical protein CQR58_010080 [Streptomyces acidiscabies]|uniref:hypothetical protein n=2 Tax=Streptomyces acidiscabies TaxID=42234 RepID=UPI0034C62C7B